jgi:hypothetical protein
MRARSNRLATGIFLLFQLMLGTRGFLWTPASAADAVSASSHAEHMSMTGAAHHSAAPATDGDCHHDQQPSDSNAPCPIDMACHAGPPCCGPVLAPALSLRVHTEHVPFQDVRGGFDTTAHHVPSRLDHALPLATAPPAVA